MITACDTWKGDRVIGVGIDLCELDRIAGMLERLGGKFLSRAYNLSEIEYIGSGSTAARRCAGLFAAKEAVVKCLGTGFASGVGWKQVEVHGPEHGVSSWTVELHDEAARRCSACGATKWTLDIQYTRLHAVAVAIWSSAGLTRP